MGLFELSFEELIKKNLKKLTEQEKEEINNLVKKRNLARQDNNFKLADEIRALLNEKNVIVEDIGKKSNWKLKDE